MIMKSQFFGFTDSGVRFTFLFPMSSIQLKLTGNQMASSVNRTAARKQHLPRG